MLVLSGWSIGVTSASAENGETASEYIESEEGDVLFQSFSSVSSSTCLLYTSDAADDS